MAELKAQLEELQLLKKTAGDVMRMHRECEDITRDISKLESELSASGSTATSDDIQAELSQLADKMFVQLVSDMSVWQANSICVAYQSRCDVVDGETSNRVSETSEYSPDDG